MRKHDGKRKPARKKRIQKRKGGKRGKEKKGLKKKRNRGKKRSKGAEERQVGPHLYLLWSQKATPLCFCPVPTDCDDVSAFKTHSSSLTTNWPVPVWLLLWTSETIKPLHVGTGSVNWKKKTKKTH